MARREADFPGMQDADRPAKARKLSRVVKRPDGQQYDKPLDEKYLMAQRYGWDIVDEYAARVQNGEATSKRAIAADLTAKGNKMGHVFVGKCLRAWREDGDPTTIGRGGGHKGKRANEAERIRLKQLLRSQPDLYLSEVQDKFVADGGWVRARCRTSSVSGSTLVLMMGCCSVCCSVCRKYPRA